MNDQFYLCGPTWPVPDVYEALVKSFVGKGKTVEAAQAYIEELKEEERYVLEVCFFTFSSLE
jgi:sulfite reductase (NADPH) flavoprotein alpha-component